MSDYSDPYNFNYATPIKQTKIIQNPNNGVQNNIPNKGFNVFNPSRGKQQPINIANPINNFSNANLNNQNDELQGNIDMDRNAYDKKNNDNNVYEDGEEIPLLEGK